MTKDKKLLVLLEQNKGATLFELGHKITKALIEQIDEGIGELEELAKDLKTLKDTSEQDAKLEEWVNKRKAIFYNMHTVEIQVNPPLIEKPTSEYDEAYNAGFLQSQVDHFLIKQLEITGNDVYMFPELLERFCYFRTSINISQEEYKKREPYLLEELKKPEYNERFDLLFAHPVNEAGTDPEYLESPIEKALNIANEKYLQATLPGLAGAKTERITVSTARLAREVSGMEEQKQVPENEISKKNEIAKYGPAFVSPLSKDTKTNEAIFYRLKGQVTTTELDSVYVAWAAAQKEKQETGIAAVALRDIPFLLSGNTKKSNLKGGDLDEVRERFEKLMVTLVKINTQNINKTKWEKNKIKLSEADAFSYTGPFLPGKIIERGNYKRAGNISGPVFVFTDTPPIISVSEQLGQASDINARFFYLGKQRTTEKERKLGAYMRSICTMNKHRHIYSFNMNYDSMMKLEPIPEKKSTARSNRARLRKKVATILDAWADTKTKGNVIVSWKELEDKTGVAVELVRPKAKPDKSIDKPQ